MRRPLSVLTVLVSALLLSACASTAPAEGAAGTGGGDAVLNVVASTSVYADVARAVGGENVAVKAIVDKTSQDPHSYEATARDMLALSKADVIVANGDGYDPFMDSLAGGLELPAGAILHAVDFAEKTDSHEGHEEHDEHAEPDAAEEHAEPAGGSHAGHDHSGPNEHVWYDVHTVGALAEGLAAKFASLRPEKAAEFEAAARAFEAKVDSLAGRIDALRPATEGKTFAMTEPLAYYLLTEAGLSDATPTGFSAAMESGDDVSPLLLKRLNDGLVNRQYALLALNTQTSGPQTDKVRSIAESAGVPILSMTETLPPGQDYISWMDSNVQQLEVALGNQ